MIHCYVIFLIIIHKTLFMGDFSRTGNNCPLFYHNIYIVTQETLFVTTESSLQLKISWYSPGAEMIE